MLGPTCGSLFFQLGRTSAVAANLSTGGEIAVDCLLAGTRWELFYSSSRANTPIPFPILPADLRGSPFLRSEIRPKRKPLGPHEFLNLPSLLCSVPWRVTAAMIRLPVYQILARARVSWELA